MSKGKEAAHLAVINNSQGDHRDYTDNTRTAEDQKSQSKAQKRRRRTVKKSEEKQEDLSGQKETNKIRQDNWQNTERRKEMCK